MRSDRGPPRMEGKWRITRRSLLIPRGDRPAATKRQAAPESVLRHPPASAAVTDALSTLGLSFQHQPLVEELPGRNQGVGQRPWVLPDIMARKEVRRQGCIKAVPRSVHSSGPNCASGHSVPPGSNRQHRRLGLGYRFRAERRAGRGCHNRGNTRWPRRKQGSLGRFR